MCSYVYIYKSSQTRGVCVHSFLLTGKLTLCTFDSISVCFSLSLAFQNAQRLGASQVTQPLTTPVVSVATPSLLTPFSMPTAYNTGESDNIVISQGIRHFAGLHSFERNEHDHVLVHTPVRCLQGVLN